MYYSFPDGESFFMDVSKVFDPKYVFTVYFPVAFALQWALGIQLLGTIIVVEWLNQILKWYGQYLIIPVVFSYVQLSFIYAAIFHT